MTPTTFDDDGAQPSDSPSSSDPSPSSLIEKSPRKAVIFLGFGPSSGAPRRSAAFADGSQAAINGVPLGEGALVQTAVREALAAGLSELIFVTQDSVPGLEGHLGDLGPAKPSHVVVARPGAARSIGEALCGIRHLIGAEPFVVLLPGDCDFLAGDGATQLLISSHRRQRGNLVIVGDNDVRWREGAFSAIASTAMGRYLLQPDVLDALERNPGGSLADAILALAEVWPAAAVPLKARPGDERKSLRRRASAAVSAPPLRESRRESPTTLPSKGISD